MEFSELHQWTPYGVLNKSWKPIQVSAVIPRICTTRLTPMVRSADSARYRCADTEVFTIAQVLLHQLRRV